MASCLHKKPCGQMLFFVSLTEYPKLSYLSLKSFDDINPLFKIFNPFTDSSREFKNLDLGFSKTLKNPNREGTTKNSSLMHFYASWLFKCVHFSRQRSLFINLVAMVLSHPWDESTSDLISWPNVIFL